ncbi:glycosyltransferase [Enterobacter chuandaensis]|uniref:Glycosyltransferase n=1 Tax=Enterobacter chuandaensis TaxID=2497875 RepID=A0AA96M8X0_9ENTR|nr:glycosyltransferase [Enterobacter chuandaensis]MCW4781410.1 glycosyltransferase [Enterobacter chuandaensis]MDA4759262.1 glycosyltransferase [Enterobacter chuandaensis]WNS39521.1 glycosyltransferase [Enterobacter chuandaensis]
MENTISVIMSVYKKDNPDHVCQAIESILNQDIRCDILIYRDGKVSAELQQTLTHYANNTQCYIYEGNNNMGLAHALNFLIDIALKRSYKFIARMDSDDISHPERLRKQRDFMQTFDDIDVLGTSCKEFGADFALSKKNLPINHSELMKFSITRCPLIHPSVMFRSKVFEKGHRYPVQTSLTEDMAFWFHLLSEGFIFANLNEVLLHYRISENMINRRKGIKKAIDEIKLRIRYMFSLKQFSLRNIIMINSRIVFHLLPNKFMRIAYKWGR